jgi:hypothetical protein
MNNKGRSALHYLRSLALLAQFQGEIDVAMEHLQEAARVAEEVGLPGELWSICVELGEMYQKQGDESQVDRTSHVLPRSYKRSRAQWKTTNSAPPSSPHQW